MIEILANRNNLMSLMYGIDIDLPWRSQSNVSINIPFDEWLMFVSSNAETLSGHGLFEYEQVLKDKSIDLTKIYYTDIAHIQLNELAISANKYKDATHIVPSFQTSDSVVKYRDAVQAIKEMDSQRISKAEQDLKKYLPEIRTQIVKERLSDFNKDVYAYCLYIQNLVTENTRIKLEW